MSGFPTDFRWAAAALRRLTDSEARGSRVASSLASECDLREPWNVRGSDVDPVFGSGKRLYPLRHSAPIATFSDGLQTP